MPGFWQVLSSNFTVLRKRDMCVYLTGNTVSLVGDWMQQTAQARVVWQLTPSATAWGLSLFFTIIGDAAVIMSFAFILAFLVERNILQLWHVYVLAFLLGVGYGMQHFLLRTLFE
jgi:hypothetical protein